MPLRLSLALLAVALAVASATHPHEGQQALALLQTTTEGFRDQASEALQNSVSPDGTTNLWYIGVICSLLASCGTVTGLLLQKYTHLEEEKKPVEQRRSSLERPLWWASLALMILIPAPLDVAAFAFADESLLAPLSAFTLVMNAILAPVVLKERLTRVDVVATVLIIVGAIVATMFAQHTERVYDVAGLYVLLGRWQFAVLFGCLCGSIAVLWLYLSSIVPNGAEAEASSSESTNHTSSHARGGSSLKAAQRAIWKAAKIGTGKRQGADRSMVPVLCGVLAGLAGAGQQMFSKSGSELILQTAVGHDQFQNALPYLLLPTAALFAVLQVMFVNRGLEICDAVTFVPMYNAALIGFGVLGGWVYFDEIDELSNRRLLCFIAGTALTVVGVLYLSRRPPSVPHTNTKAVAEPGQDAALLA